MAALRRGVAALAGSAALVLGLATGVAGAGEGDATTDLKRSGGGEHAAAHHDETLSPEVSRDLATVRNATAPYHDVEVAKAAGWPRDVTGCLAFPDGYMDFGPGAMGHHYLNFSAYLDGGEIDLTRPEALLYERQDDGSLVLTAVEYIIPQEDLPATAEPPVLFGRQMMFHPQSEAWAMHVWLWQYNPYGLFADVNPRVTCRDAS